MPIYLPFLISAVLIIMFFLTFSRVAEKIDFVYLEFIRNALTISMAFGFLFGIVNVSIQQDIKILDEEKQCIKTCYPYQVKHCERKKFVLCVNSSSVKLLDKK
jgi:hypothetical protein